MSASERAVRGSPLIGMSSANTNANTKQINAGMMKYQYRTSISPLYAGCTYVGLIRNELIGGFGILLRIHPCVMAPTKPIVNNSEVANR